MKLRHTPSRDEQQAFLDYGDRVVDGDTTPPTNDLESTFVRVQQAMRPTTNADTSRDMPDHLRMRAWEDIMQNSAAISTGRTAGHPGDRRHSRTLQTVPLQRMALSSAASIALALLVVVAGFGAWRAFDSGMGSGGNNPGPSEGRYAQAPMTPVPMATAEVSSALEPITTCDVSGNILILKDLAEDTSPAPGTSIYTVRYDPGLEDSRSDLMIGCEGEESTILASNVLDVTRGPWPGTLMVATLPENTDDLSEQQTSYVNFVNGESVTFGRPSENETHQWYAPDGSPWVIGASGESPDRLILADLRTMEVQFVDDVLGPPPLVDAIILVSQPAVDGTLVLGYAHAFASDDVLGGTLITDTEFPGDLVVLAPESSDATGISLPDSLDMIGSVWLSPDATHAAVVSMGPGETVNETYSYAIIRLSDGTIVGESASIRYHDTPFVAWVQDGTAIAYTAENSLQTLSINGDGRPETVFEADQQLAQLKSTWDQDVVTVTMREDHGSDADPDSTDIDMVYSVNVESGDVQEFPGMDASASVGWINDAGALVMFDWEDTAPETTDYRVFDPVTGAMLGTIEDAPSAQVSSRTLPTIGRNSVALSEGGEVEVIGLGTQHIYAFVVTAEGMELRRIQAPQELLSEMFLTANLQLSDDGSMLVLNGEEDEGRTHYVVSLDDPDAEWFSYTPETVGGRGRNLINFAQGTN